MATDAQINANRIINAQSPDSGKSVMPYTLNSQVPGGASGQGPATDTGKANSARNATALGLFTTADFVRPCEKEIYAEFCNGFWHDFAPEGALENSLTAEIIHAAWRLRRCALLESSWSHHEADPMEDQILASTQLSVDRARSAAQRNFHRNIEQLRRVQTERHLRDEVLPDEFDSAALGLASIRQIAPTLSKVAPGKRTQSIPRGAPCPCGSGLKHKRCCGRNAPAIVNIAA
jgi:SEC-C motif